MITIKVEAPNEETKIYSSIVEARLTELVLRAKLPRKYFEVAGIPMYQEDEYFHNIMPGTDMTISVDPFKS